MAGGDAFGHDHAPSLGDQLAHLGLVDGVPIHEAMRLRGDAECERTELGLRILGARVPGLRVTRTVQSAWWSGYLPMVHERDTTPEAAAVQTTIYRRMTSDQRTRAAAQMSAMARSITLENIRARHPEYSEHQARMALYRLLVGDELFGRAWPAEPLLAP